MTKSKYNYAQLVELFSTFTNSQLEATRKLIETEIRLSEEAIRQGFEKRE